MSFRLIIVCGAPGAGKSTYARRIAAEQTAALIELDTVSEPIIQAALSALDRDPNERDSPFYKDTFRQPVYEALFAIAAENLPHTDVIMVGPFSRELRDPEWPKALTTRFKTAVEIHFVFCEPAVRHARIRERGNPRDQSKLQDWSEHVSYYVGTEEPAFPCVHINTGQPT